MSAQDAIDDVNSRGRAPSNVADIFFETMGAESLRGIAIALHNSGVPCPGPHTGIALLETVEKIKTAAKRLEKGTPERYAHDLFAGALHSVCVVWMFQQGFVIDAVKELVTAEQVAAAITKPPGDKYEPD